MSTKTHFHTKAVFVIFSIGIILLLVAYSPGSDESVLIEKQTSTDQVIKSIPIEAQQIIKAESHKVSRRVKIRRSNGPPLAQPITQKQDKSTN
jgi:hypothetical protein